MALDLSLPLATANTLVNAFSVYTARDETMATWKQQLKRSSKRVTFGALGPSPASSNEERPLNLSLKDCWKTGVAGGSYSRRSAFRRSALNGACEDNRSQAKQAVTPPQRSPCISAEGDSFPPASYGLCSPPAATQTHLRADLQHSHGNALPEDSAQMSCDALCCAPSSCTPNENEAYEAPAKQLPLDPRLWSREDVRLWLVHMKRRHDLRLLHVDRFPTNGKGLCLMSGTMFAYRVPQGGRILYRDFSSRLARAIEISKVASLQ